MSDHATAGTSEGHEADDPSIADIVAGLTWEQLTSDGIITIDELDSMIRAKGGDPSTYDHLYGGPGRGWAAYGLTQRLETVLDLVVEFVECCPEGALGDGNSMPTPRFAKPTSK